MEYPIRRVPSTECSAPVAEIPNPPQHLYIRGELPARDARLLAVVGSRNYTNYGKQVVDHLISGLRGYPISIVSGLALGIDTLAHVAALDAGLHAVAVPGSGIDDSVLYPYRNRNLAGRILERGGCLLSEFEPTFEATPWSFPKRNRIMAGLSHAVLLVEASEKSGTLITARLTAEYNRELLVVPGNIFSENSEGVHQFLKLGATPVTSPEDILSALHIEEGSTLEKPNIELSDEERLVFDVLKEPLDHDSIIRLLPYPKEKTLVLLMQMELGGHIKEENGVFYRIF